VQTQIIVKKFMGAEMTSTLATCALHCIKEALDARGHRQSVEIRQLSLPTYT
jgi:hypothetical protein